MSERGSQYALNSQLSALHRSIPHIGKPINSNFSIPSLRSESPAGEQGISADLSIVVSSIATILIPKEFWHSQ